MVSVIEYVREKPVVRLIQQFLKRMNISSYNTLVNNCSGLSCKFISCMDFERPVLTKNELYVALRVIATGVYIGRPIIIYPKLVSFNFLCF